MGGRKERGASRLDGAGRRAVAQEQVPFVDEAQQLLAELVDGKAWGAGGGCMGAVFARGGRRALGAHARRATAGAGAPRGKPPLPVLAGVGARRPRTHN